MARLSSIKSFVLLAGMAVVSMTVLSAEGASVDELWRDSGLTQLDPTQVLGPHTYNSFELDETRLLGLLNSAPMEFSGEAGTVITVPMPDGSYTRVRVEESPILSPELESQWPWIRTYRAQGLDDPAATGRLDFTANGFHGMLITAAGTVYIEPDETRGYISFWKKDVSGERYICEVHDTEDSVLTSLGPFPATNPSGDQLRTYRLAISATGEYTQFFGGIANAAAQIATTVNRVTGIYEREVSISLMLVATNIYPDPTTDPFTGDNVSTMLGENQTDLDATVMDANYDFGHIFSQGGGGGVANQGVCVSGSKARGATSLANPAGDVFDVDFVAHEMGHQVSGSHTWNGTSGSCSAGQFVATSAYEPASGSTIMAYAGICAGQNVQPNSDDYFHTRSFDQLTAYRDGTGACGTVMATGNNPPTVDAGSNCTIPTGTPFSLTAMGDDVDDDALTFNWEQFDLGTRDGNPQSTFTTGPLFRSREATSDETRYFPRFEDILSGAATPYEVLPTVDRTLNFRVTARDNRANGGGVDYDSMQVTVSGDPFVITAPGAGTPLECGDTGTVAWLVGGGSVAANVDILFSDDGGSTFTTLLVAGTDNDGSHDLTVPQSLTSTGRIMLEPTTQCFFAVSEAFSVVDTKDPTLTAPADTVAECTAPTGTPVDIGIPTVSDLCDTNVDVSDDAPALFPLGSTDVTWTATDDSGNQTVDIQTITIEDTTPPTVMCNSPATVDPTDVPISFTATAADICEGDLTPVITEFDCFKLTKKGKRIDKTDSCVVSIVGDTITISNSGGVDDHITWKAEATDGSGNVGMVECEVIVEKP